MDVIYTKIDYPGFWDDKYINGTTNWDLKTPTPIFCELLIEKTFVNPGNMLVTGCGKGYDAIEASLHGWNVTAVDFSKEAIKSAQSLAEERKAQIQFISEDIFLLDKKYHGTFDNIYDYTTYCAINPERRGEYAKNLASLLTKKGRLIALLFPVDKRPGGPPFSIDLEETYDNFSQYLQLEFSSKNVNSIKPRAAKEVLQVYKKIKNI